MSKETVYSYSRLGSFKGCKYAYYLSYVADPKPQGKENIYSFLGGMTHTILEDLQQGKINNEEAVQKFLDYVEEADLLGLEWISEKVKSNYVSSIEHYLANWTKLEGEYELEKEFLIDIDGIKIKGFIDILVKNGNIVDVFDYKTSSKFAKRDLPAYGRQLVLYALAIQQLYPDVEIGKIAWHMLKYAKVGRKVELRADIDIMADFEPYVLEYIYNEETVNELKQYVKDVVQQIESLDNNEENYPPTANPFFCGKLCDYSDICKYYNS